MLTNLRALPGPAPGWPHPAVRRAARPTQRHHHPHRRHTTRPGGFRL